MSQMTFIYALIDPRTDEIRYVGKADDSKSRLSYHLSPCSLTDRTHKNNWLKNLLREELRPKLIILEEVDSVIWQERERYWIKKLREEGVRLTNMTDGGDGVVGEANRRRVWKLSSLKKLSDRMLGDKNPMRDPEIAARCGRATRGKSRGLGRKESSTVKATKSRAALKSWANPVKKAERLKKREETWKQRDTFELKEARSQGSTRAWANPVHREARVGGIVSAWADPVKKAERLRKGRENRMKKKAERLRLEGHHNCASDQN